MAKANAEKFSMCGDQYLGREYKNNDFDCQDFVEHMMKAVGIMDNLPGSNAWYRKMTWVGSPEECNKKFGSIPKGALLYILKQDNGEPEKYKADKIGNASHIGVYTGRTGLQMAEHGESMGASNARKYVYGDGAIHSSSSKGHVVTSTFKGKSINGGWNRVGLWDQFDYGDKINSILTGNPITTGSTAQSKEKEVTVMMTEAKVVNGALNLRAGESTTSARIALIPEGEIVQVIEMGEIWSRVTYGDKSGYVMTKYLDTNVGEKVSKLMISIPRDCAVALYEALKYSLKL